MKVAIIGAMNLNNKNINFSNFIPAGTTMIISNGAGTIDLLAEEYGRQHDIPKVSYKPNYSKNGKNAPQIRNKLIAETADLIVAIWDGKSNATKFIIEYAQSLGKPVKIYIDN